MTNQDSLTQGIAALAQVRDEQIAPGGGCDELLSSILGTPAAAPAADRRRRRRASVVAAASATSVVAGAAIAWGVTSSGATDTVSVQCEINGTDTIIAARSGDPVADCAAQWQRDTGTPAPNLTAYDNGHGGITVAPATQAPPPSSVSLPPGVTQNVTAITLQESLDDYVAGLNSSCHSADSAVTLVRTELEAAGLTDWSVSAPPGGADGTTTCADTAIVDAGSRTVLLRALGGPSQPDLPFMRLAQRLRQLSGCDSVDALARQVRAAASELGLSEAAKDYELTTVAGPGHCAVVHETVGGTIFLTIRGPNS
jgi:hypothetical protein